MDFIVIRRVVSERQVSHCAVVPCILCE